MAQKVELNLTNGKKYEADIKELSIGTVKKIIKSINWEKAIKSSKSDEEFANNIIMAMAGAWDIFEELLCDVFPGLTVKELDAYGVPSDVANCYSQIFSYTAFKISGIGAGLKNLVRAAAEAT